MYNWKESVRVAVVTHTRKTACVQLERISQVSDYEIKAVVTQTRKAPCVQLETTM